MKQKRSLGIDSGARSCVASTCLDLSPALHMPYDSITQSECLPLSLSLSLSLFICVYVCTCIHVDVHVLTTIVYTTNLKIDTVAFVLVDVTIASV